MSPHNEEFCRLVWKHSNIILLYKKGDPHKIENFRPISIFSTVAKILSKIIEKRLRNTLTMQYSKEQVGFQSSYSTIDHLHTISQRLEKSKEHEIEIHLAFIEFRKAFDALEHRFLFNALKNQGVEPHLIDIVKQLYTNIKARNLTDKKGNFFTLIRSVKQADPLSPLLFNCALEEICRTINCEGKGISINSENLRNLRFADDVTLTAKSEDELIELIKDLDKNDRIAGLEMNIGKTKILTKHKRNNITINSQIIENVDSIVYLGQLISIEKRSNKEIERRIAL